MPAVRTGVSLLLALALLAFAGAPAAQDSDIMPSGAATNTFCDGNVPHPSEILPERGIPEELPGEWARMILDPGMNPVLADDWDHYLADYRIIYPADDRAIVFHGFTFSSEEMGKDFYESWIHGTSEVLWDPGVGEQSSAWLESENQFHVLSQYGGFVLHITESRFDEETGPWPSIAIMAADSWIEEFARLC